MLRQEGNREILNLLVEWGKTHLLTPEFRSHLKELEDEYNCLIKDVEKLLLGLLQEINDEVDDAKKILSNHELITAVEDDEIHIRAEESFIKLDRFIYFMTAVCDWIAKDEKYQNIIARLDHTISNIITWLEDSCFSPLRLTAFNEFRKACLGHIPEEKRFLFPWYDRFSDLPEGTLSAIVENYEALVSGKKEMLSKEIRPYYEEIMYELKRDKELSSALKKEHMLRSALLGIAKERASINLWSIAGDMALKHIVPKRVRQAGVVRASSKIIGCATRKVISKSEKAYYLFLSAFCGPSLTSAQRLELFDKVGSLIREIEENELNAIRVKQQATLLRQIKRWYNGDDIVLDYLGDTAFKQWKGLLIETTEAIGGTQIDSSPEEFWQALEELSRLEVPGFAVRVVNIIRLIRQWGERAILSAEVSLRGCSLRMGDEEIESLTTISPLSISIPRSSQQRYPILPDPNEISTSNEYENLWNGIDPRIRGGIYVGGVILKDKAIDEIPVQELINRNFYHVEGDFLKIFLGISDNRQQLQNFVSAISKNIETLQENLNNVVILEISLQDEE